MTLSLPRLDVSCESKDGEPERVGGTHPQDFYSERPARATAAAPGAYTRVTTRQSAGRLAADTFTTGKPEDTFAGRAGRRGELTRHPAESGSVYGVSTFVDDYARWGTKLAGKTLGETVTKRTTRHFDA